MTDSSRVPSVTAVREFFECACGNEVTATFGPSVEGGQVVLWHAEIRCQCGSIMRRLPNEADPDE